MKQEKLFLTREQSLHLQELGLNMKDAAFCWIPALVEGEWDIMPILDQLRDVLNGKIPNITTTVIPTYTLQEVLDKLPFRVDYSELSFKDDYIGYYSYEICSKRIFFLLDPLQAAYEMLCWVKENNKKTNNTNN